MPYPLRKTLSAVVTLLLLFTARTGLAINYDVELIIFEHATSTSVGSSATYLYPVVDGAQQIPQSATEPTALLQPLPQLRLVEDAEKIRQSGNHRLLYHGGWRQTDFDRENAPFMAIALGARQEVFVEQGDPDSNYLRGFKLPPLDLNQNMQSRNIYQLFGGV